MDDCEDNTLAKTQSSETMIDILIATLNTSKSFDYLFAP